VLRPAGVATRQAARPALEAVTLAVEDRLVLVEPTPMVDRGEPTRMVALVAAAETPVSQHLERTQRRTRFWGTLQLAHLMPPRR
jgi:hypothetical protein